MSFVALIFIALLLVLRHIEIIAFPYPNEFREGHTYSSTVLLLQGVNPYSLNSYPMYYNSYGIVFNLIVCPFAYFFGNSLILHRLVNGIFFIIVMYLIFKPFIKKKKDILFHSVCLLVVYASILYSQNSTLRPDGLGTLLYVMALLIPIRAQFTLKSLIVSSLVALLAFYTKPYFLSGWIIISIYTLLFVSAKKAILSNIIFFFSFIFSASLVFHIFPLYFYETIFAYSSSFDSFESIKFSIEQMLSFYYFIFPITLFVISLLTLSTIRRRFEFLRNTYFVLSILISFILIYPLGINSGAFITYHQQLLLPLICLFLMTFNDGCVSNLKSNKYILTIMIFITFLYVDITPSIFNYKLKNWHVISNYIDTKNNILNSSLIAPILLNSNKHIYENGASTFVFTTKKNAFSNYLFNFDESLQNKQAEYIEDIAKQIKDKKFDAIILTPTLDKFYYNMIDMTKYELKRKISLVTPNDGTRYDLDIFEPKK